MESWEQYVRDRFRPEDGFVLTDEPLGIVVTRGGTRIEFLLGWERAGNLTLNIAGQSGEVRGGMAEFVYELPFTPANVEAIDRDLTAIVERGWTEHLYYLWGDEPYRTVPLVDGVPATNYYDGSFVSTVGLLGDLVSMGTLSRLARKRVLHFPAMKPDGWRRG